MTFRIIMYALIIIVPLFLSILGCSDNIAAQQRLVTYIPGSVNDFLATCADFEDVVGADAVINDTLPAETWSVIKNVTDTLRFSEPAIGGFYPRARYTVGSDTFCLVPNWVLVDTTYVPVYTIVKNDSLLADSGEVYCLMKISLEYFGLAPDECDVP